MKLIRPSLAGELLRRYRAGNSVATLMAETGLSQESVLTRLCVASRFEDDAHALQLDPDGGLGVQWNLVSWRA